jgi:outer membrane protein TolC
MKALLLTILLIFQVKVFAQSKDVVEIEMKDIVHKVSTEDFTVYASALRVYQAKEGITVARMNLLPRLNVWKLASAALEIMTGGPAGAVAGGFSIVEDIAPFVIPANWFRINEAELFYKADIEGYRALWSNEVLTAKSLYFHLLLDSSLLEHIRKSRSDLEEIYKIVNVRETFGGSSQKFSIEIRQRILALDEDLRALQVLISEEESLLGFMMGYPTGTKLRAKKVTLPDYDRIEALAYEDFVYRAVDVSPEIRQFDYLIEAANFVRKEVRYSFLGTSSLSRGLSGGVFDDLPVQAGLGFGTAASLRIVRAQKEILNVQKRAVTETVKRHLKLLIDNYNLDLANYKNQKERVRLSTTSLNNLYQRIRFGEQVESLALVEASRNRIDAEAALHAVMYRFLSSEDKLSRMIFHGDYTGHKAAVARFQGGLK